MPLVKCKCGRFTNNGFVCTNCQKDSSGDVVYYPPKDTEEEEELEERGLTILDSLEGYDDEEDD